MASGLFFTTGLVLLWLAGMNLGPSVTPPLAQAFISRVGLEAERLGEPMATCMVVGSGALGPLQADKTAEPDAVWVAAFSCNGGFGGEV